MSRPRAPAYSSANQPNAAVAAPVYNARINAPGPVPRHPIPMPFSVRFRPPGVPPPAPYPAPFHPIGRPLPFPPVRPSFTFLGPRVYLRPPPPPRGFIPHPGPHFNPSVYPRYITQYPVHRQPLGFPPRPINPPVGVLSHQQPAVIDCTFNPVTVARPPIAPVAPADEPQFRVFVGKIASTVDSDFVLSLLQVCGVVKNWNPVINPIDGVRTAFGFCDFESAEGSLRAKRLLNKLSIDGQQLLLNVNEATQAYLQKIGENTKETRDGTVSLADNGIDSSRATPDLTETGAVVGGQMSSQGKTKRCQYGTEEYSDSDKDAMQKILIMIEDRMKSKSPCLPTPPGQPSVSIIDEKGDNDMRNSALEERKIRRQCEKREHLRESRALGSQGKEDGEVSPPGKSSLQTHAVSSMHVSVECESTVEHKRKRQKGDNDTMNSALKERKIRRLCKEKEHLSESRALGLQDREDGEVSPPGKFSLQIDAVSSTHVSICKSIVEHKRKRQKGDNDTRNSALEERKIRRQCEQKEHSSESRALGLQGREDGEVSPLGKSFLQIDAVSSMHVSMECEPTVEHKRKRQHREREFYMKSDEEKGTVCLPGPVSEKHNSSTPEEKLDLESQATSKSGNEETLDTKQLLAAIPKMKEEIFAYDVNWAIYDKHVLHEKMRPWISEKTTEIFGEDIPEFVDYVVASTKEHVEAPRMLEALETLMDHSAEKFALSVWTKLIFEIKKVEAGLA